jgi:hypothetical protein
MPSQSETKKNAEVAPQRGPFGWVPFILGLVFPGLGHWVLGDRARAWRIMLGFLLLWFGGLLIGGFGSVRAWDPAYASGGKGEQRNLWFIAQAGAGPIAFVFDAIDKRTLRAPNHDIAIPISMANGSIGAVHPGTAIGHAAEFGTLFCALAGLMNLAVAIDAGRRTHPERRGPRASKEVRIRRGATS